MAKRKDIDITLEEEISIVGRALEIYKVLLQAVQRRNGTRDHTKRILTEEGVQDTIAGILVSDELQQNEATFGAFSIPENATAKGLVAKAKMAFKKAGIPFTRFNDDTLEIIERDLELVRGKALRVFTHEFGRHWETCEGRVQKANGFDGNAAALLVWITETKSKGWFVSIANTNDRLFRNEGSTYAPFFYRDEQLRIFSLNNVNDGWNDAHVLVAFREAV